MRNTSAFQPNGAIGLNNGLVASYRLDESSGNITDSINGITGTNTNTVTFSSGKINNGADFTETQYFDCTANTVQQVTNLTFACWVKTTDTTNNKTIIVGNSAAGSGFQWRIETNLKQQFNKQGIAGIATSTSAISSGVWTHVAVSYNYSTGVCTFYKNGVADGGATSAQTFTQNKLFIGYNDASEGMIGSLDEVCIWNRVLTSTEITELYNSTNGIQLPSQSLSTKAYYPLNGNSNDYSGNTNTGTDTSITYPQGRFGQAAKFNGSSSVVTYTTNKVITGTGSFTVSGWVNFASLNVAGDIAISVGHQATNQQFSMGAASGLMNGNWYGGAGLISTGTSAPKLNTWYHMCAVLNGASATWQMYINGRLYGTPVTAPAYNMSSSGSSGNIFGNYTVYDANWGFDGLLDEVIIESRAWTAAEVATYYRKSMLNYKKQTLFNTLLTSFGNFFNFFQ